MIENNHELKPLSGKKTLLLPVLIDLKFIGIPETHDIDTPIIVFPLPL
jgi:hypothetical protein